MIWLNAWWFVILPWKRFVKEVSTWNSWFLPWNRFSRWRDINRWRELRACTQQYPALYYILIHCPSPIPSPVVLFYPSYSLVLCGISRIDRCFSIHATHSIYVGFFNQSPDLILQKGMGPPIIPMFLFYSYIATTSSYTVVKESSESDRLESQIFLYYFFIINSAVIPFLFFTDHHIITWIFVSWKL